MRFLIHDFAGHPFPVQLSRELASRGHEVTHVTADHLAGPKGDLTSEHNFGSNLVMQRAPLPAYFRKYSFLRRLAAHRTYARRLERIIAEKRPHAVISGNTPTDVQSHVLRFCKKNDIGFVHWVQDVYSKAIEFALRKEIGALASAAVLPFKVLDMIAARTADSVIVISPGFLSLLLSWGAREDKLHVIENWAPLEDIPPAPKENSRSGNTGPNGPPRFVYSGTLGLKHRPDLIYKLAQSLAGRATVVVITEGVGRDFLAKQPELSNLTLMDFQPYQKLPEILASADVLLGTLERDAGEFAVPSKVLTYLCAGRPVLLSSPLQNLAADIIKRSGAGIVVAPDNTIEWIEAGLKLASDTTLRNSLGQSAREYAVANFDIRKIGDKFESILVGTTKTEHKPTAPARSKSTAA